MIRQKLDTWYDVLAHRLTYRVDSDTRCKIQVFLAVCVPHPDTLSMGEHNVWSYIGLQHIPAEQFGLAVLDKESRTFTPSNAFLTFSLFQ
jgi:hypothetical protein